MNDLKILKNKLNSLKNVKKEIIFKSFFKTGKGEYGESDQFLGIAVPALRKLAKEFKLLPSRDIITLLKSKFHEERALASFILVLNYQESIKKNDLKKRDAIYKMYLKNINAFNNWDLVDLSAPYISGHYFYHVNSGDIKKLINSKNLWHRRIAILSCFYFIRQSDFKLPLIVIEKRLFDVEDLIHKACGWMLREIGKRDKKVLCLFLDKYSHLMPRTALRYSLEKLNQIEKKYYMKQKENYENE